MLILRQLSLLSLLPLIVSACAPQDPWTDPSAVDTLHLNPGQEHLREQLPPSREPLMWEDYYNQPAAQPANPQGSK